MALNQRILQLQQENAQLQKKIEKLINLVERALEEKRNISASAALKMRALIQEHDREKEELQKKMLAIERSEAGRRLHEEMTALFTQMPLDQKITDLSATVQRETNRRLAVEQQLHELRIAFEQLRSSVEARAKERTFTIISTNTTNNTTSTATSLKTPSKPHPSSPSSSLEYELSTLITPGLSVSTDYVEPYQQITNTNTSGQSLMIPENTPVEYITTPHKNEQIPLSASLCIASAPPL
jgi:hypothetical protein